MKTIMNKLATVKSMPVLALVLLVALGLVFANDDEIGDNEPAPSLTGTTEHEFVGHLGTIDDKGRLLAWEGTISGDINGVIQWWMGSMSTIGHVSCYVYRVEIWNSDKTVLLLAGENAGSTTAEPGKDGVWRGKGIVTEASAEFEDWIGRQVFESGQATWAIPGVLPDHGVSTFLIPLIVDFNGDGKVDNTDISIMAGYWNTGDPVCDIGPTPLGDGIVDAQDLLVLARHLSGEEVDVDADAIYKEMCDLYTLAVETGDLELYVAIYTDDAVQIPPDAPLRIGSGQIRAAIEPALTSFNIVCPIYPQEVTVIGNWAFGRCDWSLSLTPKEGGTTTTFNGRSIDILKRQPDGSWKFYMSCWNYDGPPTLG